MLIKITKLKIGANAGGFFTLTEDVASEYKEVIGKIVEIKAIKGGCLLFEKPLALRVGIYKQWCEYETIGPYEVEQIIKGSVF